MDILFINANLQGHINPTLPLVSELAARGDNVDYFCADGFKDKVTGAGASFVGYSERLERFLAEYRPMDRHPFFMLTEYMLLYAEAMLPAALGLAARKRYDLVIGDSMFGAPVFLESMLDIPVASSHSSFAMSRAPVPERMLAAGFHPQLDNCRRIIERLRERYALPPMSLEQIFLGQTARNIVYTIPEFNGDESMGAPCFLFTGSSAQRDDIPPYAALPAERARPMIYVSLGSVNTDFADFYRACIQAFGGRDLDVVMSIGTKCDLERLGAIPDNFIVGSQMPQLSVLKRADAFITHAGFNSANEALYMGVPMLALPMINDQHAVAKRLEALGLGITADIKTLTTQALREGVDRLLGDVDIRRRCADISQKYRECKRLPQTAAALEDYARAYKEGR